MSYGDAHRLMLIQGVGIAMQRMHYENDDHHTSIYLQLNDYNSILEQSMTLYECLRRCTGICNEPRVTCMKEL